MVQDRDKLTLWVDGTLDEAESGCLSPCTDDESVDKMSCCGVPLALDGLRRVQGRPFQTC